MNIFNTIHIVFLITIGLLIRFESFAQTIHYDSGKKNDVVKIFGGDATIDSGTTANDVVVIGGNLQVNGTVQGDMVVIGGHAVVNGTVEGGTVLIGGESNINSGAHIGEDLVMIGAKAYVDPQATVNGDRVIVMPWVGKYVDPIRDYLHECLFKGRFFALSLPWTMIVLGAVFLFGIIVMLLFPHPFERSMQNVESKLLIGLLIGLLTPVAIGPIFVALAITIIGIPGIPILIILLQWAKVIGLMALCTQVGRQLIRLFHDPKGIPIIISTLIGIFLFALIMIVPFVGGLFTVAVGTVGMGIGVYTLFDLIKESRFVKPSLTNKKQTISPVQSNIPPNVSEPTTVENQSVQVTTNTNEEKILATFWQRLGAGVIDILVIAALFSITFAPVIHFLNGTHHFEGHIKIFIFLVYMILMWNWKQTSIGGIIFRLRVERIDGSRFTIGVAIVRALGLLLSMLPLGLGFLWIAWDEKKQGWHDKIAGTVVYRVPEKISMI